MAKLTRDEFISSLKEMSILEIKEEYGPDVKVVYIGSCAARGKEALRERCHGKYVDAILDFQELPRLFKQADIVVEACKEAPLEGKDTKISSLYGKTGGVISSIQAHHGFGKGAGDRYRNHPHRRGSRG